MDDECLGCEGTGQCSDCGGEGTVDGVECPNCEGTGVCPTCDGSGELDDED
jgi:hypothetical protein